MAAYAALLSLAQTTDINRYHGKYLLSIHSKDKLRSIHEYVLFLLSFLEDFPDRASRWESKIRCVAHETEDIIDLFMWQKMQLSYMQMNPSTVELKNLLNGVSETLGSIAGETMEDRPAASSSSSSRLVPTHDATSSSRLAAPTCNDAVIGLHDDLLAIKDRLCGQSSKLQVIPIVGMGGIGKTTLARTVYDDSLIMWHFDIRAWITVSQDYSTQRFRSILLGLADSMKLFEEQMLGNEIDDYEIALKVFKNLKGRRYLIVMDDVWGTEVWDNVRDMFPDDNNGSRIMLTSRVLDVAAYPDSCSPLHEMQFMNDSESWNLLKQKVFKNSNCPLDLEDTGKEIARKCLGLPLVVVLIAGLLSTVERTTFSWKEISKTVNPVVGRESEEILSSSYTHLPHHLRPCFLFIGCFPEDAIIHASRLVKLWVAEGFLKHQSESSKTMEEKAEEYLEDLVNRNLVIVNSRKRDGNIKSCRVHDMVRDFCVRKAYDEKFLHVMNERVLPQGMTNERRISLNCSYNIDSIWYPTIRTILCFRRHKFAHWLASMGRFRLLRVLYTGGGNPKELPSQLFELFHLRYLALVCDLTIPSTISNLLNLQTLIIKRPTHGKWKKYWRNDENAPHLCLPLEIWRMLQLRHVFLDDLYLLPHPPDGSYLPLQNLQTLSCVENLEGSERILQMIPNVKKLVLVYTINGEYHLQHLKNLHQLEKLEVNGCGDFSWQGHNKPSFPRTLKKLSLVGGGFPWKDMRIIGSLPNLQVLKLLDKACHGETWETTDEQFPQLRVLLIDGSDLSLWITDSSHFPRLKCLVLRNCRGLWDIPEGIGEIPTLELIEVSNGNAYLEKSAHQLKEDQEGYGNEALQVRVNYMLI